MCIIIYIIIMGSGIYEIYCMRYIFDLFESLPHYTRIKLKLFNCSCVEFLRNFPNLFNWRGLILYICFSLHSFPTTTIYTQTMMISSSNCIRLSRRGREWICRHIFHSRCHTNFTLHLQYILFLSLFLYMKRRFYIQSTYDHFKR